MNPIIGGHTGGLMESFILLVLSCNATQKKNWLQWIKSCGTPSLVFLYKRFFFYCYNI